jgi:hypothetical protein
MHLLIEEKNNWIKMEVDAKTHMLPKLRVGFHVLEKQRRCLSYVPVCITLKFAWYSMTNDCQQLMFVAVGSINVFIHLIAGFAW